jgi:ADP-dependent NAD(P)H-hydrate dehydratase / NAD(P)H-hydrate epimerase
MVRRRWTAAELGELLVDRRLNAIVLGPGGGVGQRMREMVLVALNGERAVVLDADALTSFAEDPDTLFGAIKAAGRDRRRSSRRTRASSRVCSKRERDQLKCLRKTDRALVAAVDSGATVLLKGPDTVVAAPRRAFRSRRTPPPWLDSAGSGDVLAGIIAGLLAQGMPAFEAASAAAGCTGRRAARPGRA